MKITDNIAVNLTAWMSKNPSLDTLKKVSARSQVGFGTVQRIKNGDGNPTITSLQDVAAAFGKRVEDLIAPPDGRAPSFIAEPSAPVYSDAMSELTKLAELLDESGRWQLIGAAKILLRELK